MEKPVDYDDEARKLFEKLGLPDLTDEKSDMSKVAKIHKGCANVVFKHADTGAQMYIGDEFAAKSLDFLEANNISCIVNAKGPGGQIYHD